MVNKQRKKSKVYYLKLEIQVHKAIIMQLVALITNNNITIPKSLLEKIKLLYGGGNGTEEEIKKKD